MNSGGLKFSLREVAFFVLTTELQIHFDFHFG